MSGRTKVLSVHAFRRSARLRERQTQAALDIFHSASGPISDEALRALEHVPSWAHGVRVETAGAFQHAVVATEDRGR